MPLPRPTIFRNKSINLTQRQAFHPAPRNITFHRQQKTDQIRPVIVKKRRAVGMNEVLRAYIGGMGLSILVLLWFRGGRGPSPPSIQTLDRFAGYRLYPGQAAMFRF